MKVLYRYNVNEPKFVWVHLNQAKGNYFIFMQGKDNIIII